MTDQAPTHSKGKLHFAVVGAGVAGLVCARELVAKGVRVTLFERVSAVGGRLVSLPWEGGMSDIGAQFLTARSPEFAAEMQAWLEDGLAQRWEPALMEFDKGQGNVVKASVACYVGVPSMQSLADHLARDLDIVFDTQVARITRGSAEWYLFDALDRPLGISGFDGLVLAVPSPVALGLVRGLVEFTPDDALTLVQRLESVSWDACWTASVALSRPSGIEFDVAFIRDDPILVWAARECSKPTRRKGEGVAERWLLQARANWSNNFAQLPPEEAGRWMQRAFAARLARPLAQKSCMAIRWPYATPAGFLSERFVWDGAKTIGLAGDWCGGASVESAYLSGLQVARAIMAP
jgi:predicted NAD/FAD-dependent oxidoreductase